MLILSPSVLLSTTADGYVAYDVHLDRLYRLNPTAALVVELCDGTRDLEGLERDLEAVVGDDWPQWRDWLATAVRDCLVYEAMPVDVSPVSACDPTELATHADRLQRRDRVLAAFVCQQRASQLAPDDPDVSLRLGELAHIVGRRDDARSAYQHYLSRCPDDAEVAHLMTARVLRREHARRTGLLRARTAPSRRDVGAGRPDRSWRAGPRMWHRVERLAVARSGGPSDRPRPVRADDRKGAGERRL